MTSILELDAVGRVFGGGLFGAPPVTALESVSLAIDDTNPGIVAIAGESGSGKTTLARIMLGMVAPTFGEVRFRGRPLHRLDRAGRREFRRAVQPVFQDPFETFNPFYRVDRVLAVPVRKYRLASPGAPSRALVADALERVGLRPGEILGRYPHELSGGQRQRIMVARSLLIRPLVIMADEPVSMIDASLRALVLEGLRELNRRLGIAIVYITHDLTTAFQIADHIHLLYRGQVVETGPAEAVISAPLHPYARLLVDSIPQLDPNARWSTEPVVTAAPVSDAGCRFAARCPEVFARCLVEQPRLAAQPGGRQVRCLLHPETTP